MNFLHDDDDDDGSLRLLLLFFHRLPFLAIEDAAVVRRLLDLVLI
jgi:hypothetical protein